MQADDLAARIAAEFPELQGSRLPCGGFVLARQGYVEPGVHVLFSPLSAEDVERVSSALGEVHIDLPSIFERTYAETLLSFNGALLFHPYVFLYGRQAPRETNVADVGYAPFDLVSANYFERERGIGSSELIIGGTWEPDTVITIDSSGVTRLRTKGAADVIQDEFSCMDDMIRHLISRTSPNAIAWRNGEHQPESGFEQD